MIVFPDNSVVWGLIQYRNPNSSTWNDLPCPAHGGLSYTISTIVDSGRDATGHVIGNVIGDDKYKLTITYPPLPDEVLRKVLNAFDNMKGGSFFNYIRFYDPSSGNRVTKYMYVGDRTFEPYQIDDVSTGIPAFWQNIKANLIEV
jgi:hypothetical protein